MVTQKTILLVASMIIMAQPLSHCELREAYNLQPLCYKDDVVTQAAALISSAGSTPAADGSIIDYSISGFVSFTRLDPYRTRIHAEFTGLRAFAADYPYLSMHVHQLGTTASCSDTGGHYNPCNTDHSNDPLVRNRHVADVAKVEIDAESNTLVIDQIDYQVKMSGSLSVLGRSVTIHAGAGGARVGCAPIVVAEWEGDDYPFNG